MSKRTLEPNKIPVDHNMAYLSSLVFACMVSFKLLRPLPLWSISLLCIFMGRRLQIMMIIGLISLLFDILLQEIASLINAGSGITFFYAKRVVAKVRSGELFWNHCNLVTMKIRKQPSLCVECFIDTTRICTAFRITCYRSFLQVVIRCW